MVLARKKKLKRRLVLRSKQIYGFYDHIKAILPQKGGTPPSLARSLPIITETNPRNNKPPFSNFNTEFIVYCKSDSKGADQTWGCLARVC